MYIKKIEIKNIRSIEHFVMDFPDDEEAGWHVLLGDNGAGKSSIIRSISAALIGPEQIPAILPVWSEWLSVGKEKASIELELQPHWDYDSLGKGQPTKKKNIINRLTLEKLERGVQLFSNIHQKPLPPSNYNWGLNAGWFSAGYGAFRRFTGGDNTRNKVYYSAPKAGAHLSIFGEDVALGEVLDWLKELDRKRLKETENKGNGLVLEPDEYYNNESAFVLEHLKNFINNSKLLPHHAVFDSIDIEGRPVFVDGLGNKINVTQMSEGYRSILSLTFELIRQLISCYGAKKVFTDENGIGINLPGVVLIDEIDTHLHPTWQTRIGDWFTKYFPNIQFIVTTHSPLICRACHKGSIWRLAAPGSSAVSGEVTDEQKDGLVYGNVLEAFETDIFGEDIERGSAAKELQKEYRDLYYKKRYKVAMSQDEVNRLAYLKSIFHSDVADS